MGETTGISWTHHSMNPWIGCVKVSEGCKHCYAETLATGKMGLKNTWGPNSERYITKTTWAAARAWNFDAKQAGVRRRVFCASLADVFEDHPALHEPRQRLWTLIRETPNLDWLLLTKRPENFATMLPWRYGDQPWPHVWLGVSAENQTRWNQRVPILIATTAAVRFVSYEPALGPIHIDGANRIDWIIAGGESGKDHRPFDEDWARSVRDQCHERGIAFFYKQRGGPRPEGKTAPLLDGKIHHAYPTPQSDSTVGPLGLFVPKNPEEARS